MSTTVENGEMIFEIWLLTMDNIDEREGAKKYFANTVCAGALIEW